MVKKVFETVMPERMFNEAAERLTREKVDDFQMLVIEKVRKLRDLGVTINSTNDLKKLTPSYVRKGIEESKAAQLKGQFIPKTIRQQVEREYTQLSSQIIPLVSSLQNILGKYDFTICFDGDNVCFDSDQVENYIDEQSQTDVPEVIREYYTKLQTICKDWADITKWCGKNGLTPPSMSLIRSLSKEERFGDAAEALTGQYACVLELSPEEMFNLWTHGVVREINSQVKKD